MNEKNSLSKYELLSLLRGYYIPTHKVELKLLGYGEGKEGEKYSDENYEKDEQKLFDEIKKEILDKNNKDNVFKSMIRAYLVIRKKHQSQQGDTRSVFTKEELKDLGNKINDVIIVKVAKISGTMREFIENYSNAIDSLVQNTPDVMEKMFSVGRKLQKNEKETFELEERIQKLSHSKLKYAEEAEDEEEQEERKIEVNERDERKKKRNKPEIAQIQKKIKKLNDETFDTLTKIREKAEEDLVNKLVSISKTAKEQKIQDPEDILEIDNDIPYILSTLFTTEVAYPEDIEREYADYVSNLKFPENIQDKLKLIERDIKPLSLNSKDDEDDDEKRMEDDDDDDDDDFIVSDDEVEFEKPKNRNGKAKSELDVYKGWLKNFYSSVYEKLKDAKIFDGLKTKKDAVDALYQYLKDEKKLNSSPMSKMSKSKQIEKALIIWENKLVKEEFDDDDDDDDDGKDVYDELPSDDDDDGFVVPDDEVEFEEDDDEEDAARVAPVTKKPRP